MRTTSLTLILMLACSTCRGQNPDEWAKALFSKFTHDFGVVARGSDVGCSFPIKNPYNETYRIAQVVTSCKCTSVAITEKTLTALEEAEIVATVDTTNHSGRKDATIRVVFDQPYPAEVRLQTHVFIRTDVVFSPGQVRFGSITRGTQSRQKVSVNYAGRSNWKILRVEAPQSRYDVQFAETSRVRGKVTYDLWVTLRPDIPIGYIRDHLIVVTDDPGPGSNRIPLLVEGIVTSEISAKPSPLFLGVVRDGQVAQRRNLVVQGNKPFQVLEVNGPDSRFTFQVNSQSVRQFHLIQVGFVPDQNLGKVSGNITVRTSTGNDVVVPVTVEVLAGVSNANQPTFSPSSPGPPSELVTPPDFRAPGS